MPDSSPIIEIDNVSKKYRLGVINSGTLKEDFLRWWSDKSNGENNSANNENEIWALKNVNLSIKKGEVLGIIGNNGAGKSTLLKILSRITGPTNGTIRLKGKTASLLEVGTGFHPELSGKENIFLNGAILGMTKSEIMQRFDDIVEFSGVAPFIETPVKRYSSGMYVRLAFSVAAHLNPDILIVDEVLAVGDQSFQEKCIGKMQSVSKSGRTVLFVSHNLHTVKKLCNRAILLENGNISTEGDVNVVINKYSQHNKKIISKVNLPSPADDCPLIGKNIYFTDAECNPRNTFYLRESWKVKIDFEVTESLPHVIATLGIVSEEGITISTIWSAPKDLNRGSYSVDYHINIPFAANALNFIVSLSSREKALYYVENIGIVNISEISLGEQPVYRASGHGLLLIEDQPIIQES
jgi:lipopolysaccharide transport system ATP-binding protein